MLATRVEDPEEIIDFTASRRLELEGLISRGTFEVVKRSSVPPELRVYKTKWVDTMKTRDDGSVLPKSRLVAQNFRDDGAADIDTRAPTITRMSQRMAVASAAMTPHQTAYIRDVSQAYIQSASQLSRPVYLEAPNEMHIGEDELLLARKPLYGVPESGLHWFLTYQGHHKNELDMKVSKADSCLLYRRTAVDGGKEETDGITILQVDDSFGHGSVSFLAREEIASKRFDCKPRLLFEVNTTARFNGSTLVRAAHGYSMHQRDKLDKIRRPETQKDLVSVRAALQYIAGCTRPDVASCVQLLSSAVASPTAQTYREMANIVNWIDGTRDLQLNFVALDMNTLRMVVFADASFANASSLASQIGFVVCLADDGGNANIVHYGSQRCKRVTRSVMAAELHALSYGFDQAFVAHHVAEEIFAKQIPLDAYIDSRTVFNTVTRCTGTLEKRLQIDASALRESHARGELRSLAWIPSHENVADAMTKGVPQENHALMQLMRSNRLCVHPQGWVRVNNSDTEKSVSVDQDAGGWN
jgi:hypothetical protein